MPQDQERDIEQRKTSGEEIPPSPTLRRQGDRPGAGADTPAGPFPQSSGKAAKRERKKQEEILERENDEQDRGEATPRRQLP